MNEPSPSRPNLAATRPELETHAKGLGASDGAPKIRRREIVVSPLPGLIATVSEDDIDMDDAMPIGYWLTLAILVALLVTVSLRSS
ncbi:hypothetical protein QTI33_09990 [Variovorax sp. J22P271]|uniref:hypothetical protein n=1 Tax=Variovorax davisae TaxID=3053515 RepID=UPI0025776E06|nr:hypothetical protein [Variovorax sp. J22P271]MDM0032455.1 hypothetical protein [Variovorax sp. J22P271]